MFQSHRVAGDQLYNARGIRGNPVQLVGFMESMH